MADATAAEEKLPENENEALAEKVLTQKTDIALRKILAQYMALCQVDEGDDAVAVKELHASFAKELHLFEFEVGKSKRVRRANTRELETYAKKHTRVEERIKETNGDISRLRTELEEARVERRHQEEYDLLARKILELPSRQESMAAMATLEVEIKALEADESELSATEERRKKQFALLLTLIHDLECTLKAEEPDEQAAAVPEPVVKAVKAEKTEKTSLVKRKAADLSSPTGESASSKKDRKQ